MDHLQVLIGLLLVGAVAGACAGETPAKAPDPSPLPGTAPLTLDGDIASRLVAGADAFLLREIEWFVGPHTINGKGTFDFLHKHLAWPKRP